MDLILATKTRPPRPPRSLIPRPALVERLRAARAPLVLISAPAGFGKTSLAAEYLAALRSAAEAPAAAWLSLEAEDDEPGRFWSSAAAALLRALEGARPGAALEGLAALAELPPSLRPAGPELAAALAEALESFGAPALLVLDDFHLLSSPELLGSFARFAERMPASLQVILLSRSDPALPLARFRARGLCAELRAEELRFGPDEAELLLARASREAGGPILTREQVLRIDRKAEGWAAGLQMAALSLSRGKDAAAFVESFSGSDRFILEFLVEEVLAAQCDELRAFLLDSSLLERFCAPLCAAALGIPEEEARRLVGTLEAGNLFLVPLDDEGSWFRYHHLFGEALRARRRACAKPAAGCAGLREEGAILKAAAAWREGRGEGDEAVGLYLKAGDPESAAEVLSAHAFEMLARGERLALSSRLALLSEERILARPPLAEAAGWLAVFSGRPAEAEPLIGRIEAAASRAAPGPGRELRCSATVMRAFLLCMRGRLAEARARAAEAEGLLGEERLFERSVLYFVKGLVARSAGEFARAAELMQSFLALALGWGEPWTVVMAYNEVLTCALARGELGRAREAYEGALADLRRRGIGSVGSGVKIHGNYADLLYERDELEAMEELLEPRLEGEGTWLLPTDILMVLSPAVRLRLAQGKLEAARCLLARIVEMAGPIEAFPRGRAVLRDIRIQAALAEGKIEEASSLAEAEPAEAMAGEELRGVRWLFELSDLRILLARKRGAEAARRGLELAEAARRGGGLAIALAAWALAAGGLAAAGEPDRARELLVRALDAGRAEGFVRSYADLGPALEPLLEELAAGDPVPARAAQARLVLAAARRERGLPEAAREAAARTASPRELEVLGLLAEGLGNRDIAERLFVSEATVKTHLHHLAEKLGAGNRTAILARARERGLLGR
ncbi:MAG TPA: LuxR C-terminal-related transcriptional regulator [Spirochaetales bacterium]|nr:LuxR C-terminal-related transcriptional regulator [Spirochaetales bacterium]HRY54063.1 LuxR C-terminal-related transcriptional regulator [Spirochaetia bacterium]